MARYLGALATRLARIEAERTSMHMQMLTESGRRVSLDVRDVLTATHAALRWVYDESSDRPTSHALHVLATVDPATQPSVFVGTAVRVAHALAGGERP